MFWNEHWTDCDNMIMYTINEADKELLIELTPGESGFEDNIDTYGFIRAENTNGGILCPYQPFIR